MPLIVIDNDVQFVTEMNNQGVNLVVVDFFATWCGPCRVIAPKFEQLSRKYPKATFLKVDVDKCQQTMSSQGISAMPTFVLYRNKTKLGRVQGADAAALEAKIMEHYGGLETDDNDTCIPGHINLISMVYKSQCEALNESDEHPLTPFLEAPNNYLESDCDAQLIISLTFVQAVKIHSIKFKAPKDSGPKTVKLFINQPTTLDFDSATNNTATQEIEVSPENLEGVPINLRFVKFQNVQNLQIFIKDNQTDSEITRIDDMVLYGLPVITVNMGEFKRITGVPGEAH